MKLLVVSAALLSASLAFANPHELPYTYTTESLPKGALEVEQYADLTPVSYVNTTGAKVFTLRSILTTEFEYGISNKLELGLYFQMSNDPADPSGSAPFGFDGIKQRLRYRLAAPGKWPVDVGFYLEIAELRNEFELEWKVLLQRRVGPVGFMVNLWAEHESYYDNHQEWVINPTAGVTWQIHPVFHLGLEFWMHAEWGTTTKDAITNFNNSPHYMLGPAVMFEFGRFWWSTGAYVRLDGLDEGIGLGSQWGHVWIRTMLGIEI